ncbi:MAG: ATP-binding cassette domain-containing protein [Paracoccaceae bacterium]
MLTLEGMEHQQDSFHLSASFSLETGTTTAVIGPSGGGKSTLLNCIAGFAKPRRGRVIWNGEELSALNPGERPISSVFQDNNLFPHMSCFENVAIGLRPSLRLTGDETAQVRTALIRVGLAELSDRKPAALSGGQQSRVALARVLVRQRPLLLLDEPFAALGPALRGEMLDLVAELAAVSRATLLMVTHDPSDAKRIAQQTIFVEAGKVHPPVATLDLFAAPPKALEQYLGVDQ